MSNETKRDVFEYYLDMIKALKDPLAAECVNEARQRYAAALDNAEQADCPYCRDEYPKPLRDTGRYMVRIVDDQLLMRDKYDGHEPHINLRILIQRCPICGRNLTEVEK